MGGGMQMLAAAGSSALRRNGSTLWRQWKHRFMLMTLPLFCNVAMTRCKALIKFGEWRRRLQKQGRIPRDVVACYGHLT